jgi:hypothetical protein
MKRFRTDRGGLVYVLALVLLVVLTSVAVTVVGASGLSIRSSDNYDAVTRARLVAESGLAFLVGQIQQINLPYSTSGANFLTNLNTVLGNELNGTGNLAGQTVGINGSGVDIPQIQTGEGGFSARITWLGSDLARLEVVGQARNVSRTVAMNLELGPKASGVFDYGIASRGKIVIKGNATFDGVNMPEEANILSTKSTPVAIEAGGSAYIGGDLSVTGEEGDYIIISGRGLSIGGTSDINEIVEHHLHLGVDDPEWPEVDISPFVPMAVNVLGSSSPGGGTYTNIRIPAGTNPSFGGDTVVNGVMYIESPNQVKFTAKATINGVVVTEEDPGQALTDCQIDFRGQASAPGVQGLPNTEEWQTLKQYVGTVILAPGFGVSFRGNTNTINGTVAADELSFLGNSSISGNVTGSVLGLKNLPMTLSGSCTIKVDKLHSSKFPPGFQYPRGLTAVADSYAEVVASAE